MKERLAKQMKRLRGQRGLTQAQLAKKAGLSWGYLARMEIGMHDPSLSTVQRLAKALKVSVAELVR